MFDDFSIPGSQNVDIVEVVSNPSYLVGTSPLIIVDRDGSYAMAIGGILSQKTPRPIKVLYEGLESYWMESDFSGISVPMSTTTPQIQISPPASSSTPAAPSVTQPTTKKKSAGC